MNLTHKPVAQLVEDCRRESARFQRGEPSDDAYCFELFRRAIGERDHAAWDALVTQYRGIVLSWVRRRSTSVSRREDDDYWVSRAFGRFWGALGPDRFGQFHTVAALLRYLQLCVFSEIADEARAASAATSFSELERAAGSAGATRDTADTVLGEMSARELWAAIAKLCATEAERRVVYLSFALGLTSRGIHERHPDLFATVADVYRVTRNVHDRLRRSPEIRAFLTGRHETRSRTHSGR